MRYKRLVSLLMSLTIIMSNFNFAYAHNSRRGIVDDGINIDLGHYNQQDEMTDPKDPLPDQGLILPITEADRKDSTPGASDPINGNSFLNEKADDRNGIQDLVEKVGDAAEMIREKAVEIITQNEDHMIRVQDMIYIEKAESTIEIDHSMGNSTYWQNFTISGSINEEFYKYLKGESEKLKEVYVFGRIEASIPSEHGMSFGDPSAREHFSFGVDLNINTFREAISTDRFVEEEGRYKFTFNSRKPVNSFIAEKDIATLILNVDVVGSGGMWDSGSIYGSVNIDFAKGSYVQSQIDVIDHGIRFERAEAEETVEGTKIFRINGRISEVVSSSFFPNSDLDIRYYLKAGNAKYPLKDELGISKRGCIHRMYPTGENLWYKIVGGNEGDGPIGGVSFDRLLGMEHSFRVPDIDRLSTSLNYLDSFDGGLVLDKESLAEGQYEILAEIYSIGEDKVLLEKTMEVQIKESSEESQETRDILNDMKIFDLSPLKEGEQNTKENLKDVKIRFGEPESLIRLLIKAYEREIILKGSDGTILYQDRLRKTAGYSNDLEKLGGHVGRLLSTLEDGEYILEIILKDPKDPINDITKNYPFSVVENENLQIKELKSKLEAEVRSVQENIKDNILEVEIKMPSTSYHMVKKARKIFDYRSWVDCYVSIFDENDIRVLRSENIKELLAKNPNTLTEDEIEKNYSGIIKLPLPTEGNYVAKVEFLYDKNLVGKPSVIKSSEAYRFNTTKKDKQIAEDNKKSIMRYFEWFDPQIVEESQPKTSVRIIGDDKERLDNTITIYNYENFETLGIRDISREFEVTDSKGAKISPRIVSDQVIFEPKTENEQYHLKLSYSVNTTDGSFILREVRKDIVVPGIKISEQIKKLQSDSDISLESLNLEDKSFVIRYNINKPLYDFISEQENHGNLFEVFEIRDFRGNLLQKIQGSTSLSATDYDDHWSHGRFANKKQRIDHSVRFEQDRIYYINVIIVYKDPQTGLQTSIDHAEKILRIDTNGTRLEQRFEEIRERCALKEMDQKTFFEEDMIVVEAKMSEKIYRECKNGSYQSGLQAELLIDPWRTSGWQTEVNRQIKEYKWDTGANKTFPTQEIDEVVALRLFDGQRALEEVILRLQIPAKNILRGSDEVSAKAIFRVRDSEERMLLLENEQEIEILGNKISFVPLSGDQTDDFIIPLDIRTTRALGQDFDIKAWMEKEGRPKETVQLNEKIMIQKKEDHSYHAEIPVKMDIVSSGKWMIWATLIPKNSYKISKNWRSEPLVIRKDSNFSLDLQSLVAPIPFGQEKTIECRLIPQNGIDESLELKIIIDGAEQSVQDLTITPSGQNRVFIDLPTDKVGMREIRVVAISKFDRKEVVATQKYTVEATSDFTLSRSNPVYLIPKGQRIDTKNDIQIRNKNHTKDRITLQYIAENVDVQGPGEIEVQGQSSASVPLQLTPKNNERGTVRIIATSGKDNSQKREVSFAVQTRELISNQFVLNSAQSSISLYENERERSYVEISNTGDVEIPFLTLTAREEEGITVRLEESRIQNLKSGETRRVFFEVISDTVESDYINRKITITATGSDAVSLNKTLYVQILKKKGKLLINNNQYVQVVSGGLNEEVQTKLVVENVGNAKLQEIALRTNDPQIEIVQPSISELSIGESHIFDVKIKPEAAGTIGEFAYQIEVVEKNAIKGIVAIKHIVSSDQTGQIDLKIVDIDGKVWKRGIVVLEHKDLGDVRYEFDLSALQEDSLIQELQIGKYKLNLLTEDNKSLKAIDIEILPKVILKERIQLDIKDKLFETDFKVEKKIIKDGYTIEIISIAPGSILPDSLPSIQVRGDVHLMEAGQKINTSLIITNPSKHRLENIRIDSMILKQVSESNDMVKVILHDPGEFGLAPGEGIHVPVTIIAPTRSMPSDETTLEVKVTAECPGFSMTRDAKTVIFSTAAIGGVIQDSNGNIQAPTYPGGSGYQTGKVEKPRVGNYAPQTDSKIQLNIASKIIMDREILDAQLRLFGIKEEIKIKSIDIHILDANRENVTHKFYKKVYKGSEYIEEATISPQNEYEIAWYLAENEFFVESPSEFTAFAQIIYEQDGKENIEDTDEVRFVLEPLPYLDVELEMPSYMEAGKQYEIKTTIHNIGKGIAKNFDILSIGSALEKDLGTAISSGEIKTDQEIKPGESVTTVITLSSSRSTAIENRLIRLDYQNELDLEIMPLIKGISIKINNQAKQIARERIKKRNHPDPASCINDPIDLSSGAQIVDLELLAMEGNLPLQYFISYNSHLRDAASHGNGWSNIFDMRIEPKEEGIDVYYSSTKKNSFVQNADGTYRTSDADRIDDILTKEGSGFVLSKKDNITYHFDNTGRLIKIAYKDDKAIDITYTENTKTITDNQTGIYIIATIQDGKVSHLSDSIGRQVSLNYDEKGNLIRIQDATGGITRYEYDEENRLIRGYDPMDELIFENTYDEMDRIIKQTDTLSTEGTNITYEETDTQLLAIVTDRRGNTKTYTHDKITGRLQKLEDGKGVIFERVYDENGRLIEEKDAQASIHYEYDARGNITKITDKLGRVTTYTYDEQGNLLTRTTPRQNTTVMTYDDHGKLLTIKNPIGDVLENEYDTKGNLLQTTLPNQDKITYTIENGRVVGVQPKQDSNYVKKYDAIGRIESVENPVGGAIHFTYCGDNQIKTITDEAGSITKFEYDKRGNLSVITDATGHTQKYRYNLYKDLVWYQDQEGNQTTYIYDAERNLLSITDANGGKISYTYDERGQKTQETDQLGQKTTYTYDTVGNLIRISKADRTQSYRYDAMGQLLEAVTDQVTNYSYDEDGNLTTVTDADGEKQVVNYDAVGRILSVIDKEGHQESYTYDQNGLKEYIGKDKNKITYEREYGQISKIIDAAGNELSYIYDSMGRVTTVTDQEGNVHKIEYNATGKIQKIIDPYDQFVEYDYDVLGRKIRQTDKNNNTTRFEYTPNGNLRTITDALGNITEFEYDALGNLIRETDALGNTTVHQYNKRGDKIQTTTALGNEIRYEYNTYGELIRVQDAIGEIAQYKYNNKWQLILEIDALGNETAYTYDAKGQIVKKLDPNGNETHYHYDKEGRLIQTKSGKETIAIQSYDQTGRLQSITDPKGRMLRFEYDSRGNLITQSEIMYQGDKATKYRYNAKNLLEEIQNAKGQKTTLTYDKLGRVIKRKEKGDTTTYRYDAQGNILEVKNKQGKILRQYDALGRVIQVTDTNKQTIKYQYDAVGNLQTLTYPTGRSSKVPQAVHYTYDAIGNIKTVTDWNDRVTTYNYDIRGQEIGEQRPNGSIKQTQYDMAGRITQLLDQDKNGNILLQYELTYDKNGNIIRRTSNQKTTIPKDREIQNSYTYDQLTAIQGQRLTYDKEGNVNHYYMDGKKQQLIYDQRNRLTQAGNTRYLYDSENARIQKTELLDQDKNGNILLQYELTYDKNGNIIRRTSNQKTTIPKDREIQNSYTYDQLTAIQGQRLTYDKEGNVNHYYMDGKKQQLIYDQRNRLTQAGNTRYLYDSENARIQKTEERQIIQYTIDKENGLPRVLQEQTKTGTIRYIYGNGLIGQEQIDNKGN
ncbi:MAG: DUF6531 domain-containing protein, partial [Peptostreptococcaceae bacterium]|nr:DUF6531 domain-containing protein [Peptostreptococcaceae bacterium]